MKKQPAVELSFYMSPDLIRISGKYAGESAGLAGVNPSTDVQNTLRILNMAEKFFSKLKADYQAKIVPKCLNSEKTTQS
jgi:hypothetical protein